MFRNIVSRVFSAYKYFRCCMLRKCPADVATQCFGDKIAYSVEFYAEMCWVLSTFSLFTLERLASAQPK